MAKVLYGALRVDGKLYEPGTKVSGLSAKVKKVVRDQKVYTVDESQHPVTAEEVEPEDWEVADSEDEIQDEDEE